MNFASHKETYDIGSETIQVRHYDIKLFSISDYAQQEVAIPKSIETSVTKRQAEFLAGRLAARNALRAIQFSRNVDIPIGRFREPVWPKEIIGAISHTDSIAISLVKNKKKDVIVGLDIENIMSEHLCNDIEPLLMSPKENELLKSAPLPRSMLLSILFSAKETLFKALFREVRQYINFLDSEVTYFSSKQQIISLRITPSLIGIRFRDKYDVHFRIFGGKVMTLLNEFS